MSYFSPRFILPGEGRLGERCPRCGHPIEVREIHISKSETVSFIKYHMDGTVMCLNSYLLVRGEDETGNDAGPIRA